MNDSATSQSRLKVSPPSRRVLYVGPFRFPEGDAGGQRVLSLAKAIRATGRQVEFCGWTKKSDHEKGAVEKSGTFDGFPFRNLPEFRAGGERLVRRLQHHLQEGILTLRWLHAHAGPSDIVVLYNWYGIYPRRIISLCKSRGIPVIVDSVEWYDPSHCPGGRFGLVRWEVEYSLRSGFRRADGIIAVSSYLARHFSSSTPTIKVPPLVDAADEKWKVAAPAFASTGAINLVYCGVPGRKDALTKLIAALGTLENSGNQRFFLTLVGPEKEQIESLLKEEEIQFPRNVLCLGRQSHLNAIKILGQADFSVLIRPDRRYAHAGFSTKFVESLAVGTPPFCNLTSDIHEVSEDGRDSIHLRGETKADILLGLQRIALINAEEHREMRFNARETAARLFDWRNYTNMIGKFLDGICE
jgi:glycosyltransferase involved in cell wall biosynthesis